MKRVRSLGAVGIALMRSHCRTPSSVSCGIGGSVSSSEQDVTERKRSVGMGGIVRMVVQNSSFTLVSTGNRRVATGWLMAWHAVGDSASPAASVLSSVVLVTATAVSEAVSGVGAVSGAVSKGSGGGCGSLSCLPSGGDGLSGCCGKSSLCSSE